MVYSAERQLLETIVSVMASRTALVLGIGPRELLWDGQRIKSRLSVVREVAVRLQRRGVSTITFQQEVTRDSVRFLLAWLTGDAAAVAAAQQHSESGTPHLSGFVIGRIPYDELVLADSAESNEAQVASIWAAIRTAAIARKSASENVSRVPADATSSLARDASEIVAAIRDGTADVEYVKNVSRALFTMVDQATHATPTQRAAIGERLRAVLPLLDGPSVAAILAHMGDAEQQRQFVSQVTEMLPLNAVVDWLEVAARAGKHDLSHQLLRLLRKLSTLSQAQSEVAAPDSSFRDATLDLVSGWDIDDPNPGEHMELLDQIALIESDRTGRSTATSPDELLAERHSESARLVQMALELDEVADDTRVAVTHLMLEGRASELLAWIALSPGTKASAALLSAAAAPEILDVVLQRPSADIGVVRLLLGAADERAIPVLIRVLAVSDVRMIRRVVLERLREFGPVVWNELLSHLDDGRWYFVRNLLGLMREVRGAVKQAGGDVGQLPLTGVARHLSHTREQVRLETVRLLLENTAMREGALRRALDDPSDRVVREGVEWIIAQSDAQPEGILPMQSTELFAHLLRLIGNAPLAEEVRARAVWALDSQRSVATLDWLLLHVTRRRFLTRRLALVDSRPTVLAALGLLSKRYAAEKRALPALAMARKTNDLRRDAVQRGADGAHSRMVK